MVFPLDPELDEPGSSVISGSASAAPAKASLVCASCSPCGASVSFTMMHQPLKVPPLHRSNAHVDSASLENSVSLEVEANPGHKDRQVVQVEGKEGVADELPVVATNPGPMVQVEGKEGVPSEVPVVATNPGPNNREVVQVEGKEGVAHEVPVVTTNPGHQVKGKEGVPDKLPVVATNPGHRDRKVETEGGSDKLPVATNPTVVEASPGHDRQLLPGEEDSGAELIEDESKPTQHYEPEDEALPFLTRKDQHKRADEALQEVRKQPGRGRGRGRGRGKGQGRSKGESKPDEGKQKEMKDAGDNAQPKRRTRKPKVSKDEQAAQQQADEAIAQPKKRAKVMKKPAARPSRKRGPDGPPDDERRCVEQVYQHTLFDVYWNRPAIGLKIRATGRQAGAA